jgi:hypothetical protein
MEALGVETPTARGSRACVLTPTAISENAHQAVSGRFGAADPAAVSVCLDLSTLNVLFFTRVFAFVCCCSRNTQRISLKSSATHFVALRHVGLGEALVSNDNLTFTTVRQKFDCYERDFGGVLKPYQVKASFAGGSTIW